MAGALNLLVLQIIGLLGVNVSILTGQTKKITYDGAGWYAQ